MIPFSVRWRYPTMTAAERVADAMTEAKAWADHADWLREANAPACMIRGAQNRAAMYAQLAQEAGE
jgi:2-keto-3-deoxy-L-rhamnonate aldolase RhmA